MQKSKPQVKKGWKHLSVLSCVCVCVLEVKQTILLMLFKDLLTALVLTITNF